MPQESRVDAHALVEAEGLAYARERSPDGSDRPYWYEGAAYAFDPAEVDRLEAVTAELHGMAIEATRAMARDPQTLRRLGLPAWVGPYLRESVERDWTLYGRFDLAWDGESEPKLLEYNADTPAALVETAVTQWNWLEAVQPERDQWNMVHEFLVHTWRHHVAPGSLVHLTAGPQDPLEDWNTVAYLADTVREAGAEPVTLPIDRLGLEHATGRFVDEQDRHVSTCFSMYPWDWMLRESFARPALDSDTTWLEPVHKVLTGSKALLVFLWGMYPGHPNLLPADWTPKRVGREHVVKPVFGWEGAGVQIVREGATTSSPPRHTSGHPLVYQAYHPIPEFSGALPVLGTWVIGGRPAGLGIRETDATQLVTDASARFVPHFIDGERWTPEQVAAWVERSPS